MKKHSNFRLPIYGRNHRNCDDCVSSREDYEKVNY